MRSVIVHFRVSMTCKHTRISIELLALGQDRRTVGEPLRNGVGKISVVAVGREIDTHRDPNHNRDSLGVRVIGNSVLASENSEKCAFFYTTSDGALKATAVN